MGLTNSKEDFLALGFRIIKNPKKKDNYNRLTWGYFREAGQVFTIVIVKKEYWEIESTFIHGDKIENFIFKEIKGTNLEDYISLVKSFNALDELKKRL